MEAENRSRATTLAALLSAATNRHPDKPALIEREADRLASLTFAELSGAVAALSSELRTHGVGRGDVVAVWLPNWSETVVWEFALAALGAAVLGVNTRYGIDEIAHLLERARPVGVVAPARFLDLDFAGRLQDGLAAAGDVPPPWVALVRAQGEENRGRFDVGGGTWTWSSMPVVNAAAVIDHPPADGKPGDPVNYFTTSGSTGLPKLAGHDQASIATHCVNVATALDMGPGDVFLGVLPLSGVFGFNPAMAMLGVGGACLLEPVFDPELVLGDMEATGVTHAVGGDDMLGRLMDAWHHAAGNDRPALRRVSPWRHRRLRRAGRGRGRLGAGRSPGHAERGVRILGAVFCGQHLAALARAAGAPPGRRQSGVRRDRGAGG